MIFRRHEYWVCVVTSPFAYTGRSDRGQKKVRSGHKIFNGGPRISSRDSTMGVARVVGCVLGLKDGYAEYDGGGTDAVKESQILP